jgi:hypothetical protein
MQNVQETLRLLGTLVAVEAFLVAVYLVEGALGAPTGVIYNVIHYWFNLDSEANIPLSSTALLITALVFVFLSMDEVSEVHEKVSRMLRPLEWVPRMDNGRRMDLGLCGHLGGFAGRSGPLVNPAFQIPAARNPDFIDGSWPVRHGIRGARSDHRSVLARAARPGDL